MTATSPPQRPRVLLVDDDPRILSGLRRQLHRQYDVTTAAGGEQGLQALRNSGPFAAVISDMRMPGMDGATFLAEVRAHSPQTTRMLLTGQTELSAAIRAINDGQVFRFLDKPCQPQVLERALQEAVARYQTACDQERLLAAVLTDRRVMAGRDAYPDRVADPRVGSGGHDFRLCYQPILEFAQERVTAVAAVLCGFDGSHEQSLTLPMLAAPADGPTIPLRRWMLAAACQEVASWPAVSAGGLLQVHIKVSAGQLLDPLASDDLARTLVLSGLEPHRVVLAVLDAAVAQEERSRDFLRTVAAWGVRLAVVCTGADTAPLSLADSLPVSMVKLFDVDAIDPGLVRAAHDRGLTVGVEGISTADDDRRARAAGCETGEGGFYGDATDPSHLLVGLADVRLT